MINPKVSVLEDEVSGDDNSSDKTSCWHGMGGPCQLRTLKV